MNQEFILSQLKKIPETTVTDITKTDGATRIHVEVKGPACDINEKHSLAVDIHPTKVTFWQLLETQALEIKSDSVSGAVKTIIANGVDNSADVPLKQSVRDMALQQDITSEMDKRNRQRAAKPIWEPPSPDYQSAQLKPTH